MFLKIKGSTGEWELIQISSIDTVYEDTKNCNLVFTVGDDEYIYPNCSLLDFERILNFENIKVYKIIPKSEGLPA